MPKSEFKQSGSTVFKRVMNLPTLDNCFLPETFTFSWTYICSSSQIKCFGKSHRAGWSSTSDLCPSNPGSRIQLVFFAQ